MDCDNEDDNPETWVTPEKGDRGLAGGRVCSCAKAGTICCPKGDKEPRPKVPMSTSR